MMLYKFPIYLSNTNKTGFSTYSSLLSSKGVCMIYP